jgi:hypothetical protein
MGHMCGPLVDLDLEDRACKYIWFFGFGQSSFIYVLLERTFGDFKLTRSSNGNGTNLNGSYTLVSNA